MLLLSKFRTASCFSPEKSNSFCISMISLPWLLSPYRRYLITLILLCRLVQQVDVIPPSIKSLKFGRFLGCGEIPLESWKKITTLTDPRKRTLNFLSVSGFLLLARVVAVTFCVTLAASLAARHGPTIMAGFQICCQLWLATSLLADGLAVAGQVILLFRYHVDWFTEKLHSRKVHYQLNWTVLSMTDCRLCLQVRLPKMITRK